MTSQIDTPNRISSDVPNAHWNNTFDKLQIWGLTQFEKLVFLIRIYLLLIILIAFLSKNLFLEFVQGNHILVMSISRALILALW